jgi:hypothetical protein
MFSTKQHENAVRKISLLGSIARWSVVLAALLLSLAALMFQIRADVIPVVLLTVAAILAVVNLLPKRDLGL